MKNHRIFKKNREYDQDEYIRLLYLTSMCVCAYPHACVPTKSLQYCQLCDPMDCSPPGSSVRGILQARMPGWVAEPSSGGSSWLRGGTRVSCSSCIAGGFFTIKPQQGAHVSPYQQAIPGLISTRCLRVQLSSDTLHPETESRLHKGKAHAKSTLYFRPQQQAQVTCTSDWSLYFRDSRGPFLGLD